MSIHRLKRLNILYVMNANKTFLIDTVPHLLNKLKVEDKPKFGVMTPHHMIEHLVWVTKSSVKDFGPPPAEIPEKILKFMQFVRSGRPMQYKSSSVTLADLNPPRTEDLQTAIALVPEALQRLYAHDSDQVFYNPMMGKLTFEELEHFHAIHYRHHLENQYGLSL